MFGLFKKKKVDGTFTIKIDPNIEFTEEDNKD